MRTYRALLKSVALIALFCAGCGGAAQPTPAPSATSATCYFRTVHTKGHVFNKETKKPIDGATLTIASIREDNEPFICPNMKPAKKAVILKTDKDGFYEGDVTSHIEDMLAVQISVEGCPPMFETRGNFSAFDSSAQEIVYNVSCATATP